MESRDSDQSISEAEDDVGISWPRNLRVGNNKDGLEMLTFQDGESKFMQSSTKIYTSNSDEEISDVEENNVSTNTSFISKTIKYQKEYSNNYESKNQDEASMWSTVDKEAEELIVLHDNAGCSSSRAINLEPKKISKGTRGKAKPKFSIHFLSHKAEPSLALMAKDENEQPSKILQMDEGLEDLEDIVVEHSITDLLEGLQEEKTKQSEVQVLAMSALGHRNTEHSMTELLEGLQGKDEPAKRTSKMNTKTRGRKHEITRKKNMYQLGYRTLDNEDPAEPMDSDTSSEDEAVEFVLQANGQNQMKLVSPETKGQTMADRFHEAFDATAVNDDGGSLFGTSKQTGVGYYGRLQQIMQTEKERHVEFLKQSQGMSMHDKMQCIDVKILSRYLDAKLTVCQCSCGENDKSSHCPLMPLNSVGYVPKRTIIFSSRMCDNVEIEVGNFIRIHPPWKEVQVMGSDESIILCTYFSQI